MYWRWSRAFWVGFAMVGVLLALAFYISLGGRTLIKAETLDG